MGSRYWGLELMACGHHGVKTLIHTMYTLKTVNMFHTSNTHAHERARFVKNKYECTMDPERVCATVVTTGCYNSCVHLRCTSRCILIFICNRQMVPLLVIR